MNNLIFRFFCFYMSVVFLSGCRQDDETDINKMPEDMVAVNIPIGGISIESDDPLPTRGSSSETLTVTENLDDSLILETCLVPVSAANTRGKGTNNLQNNVQILALVYKDGSLYKYQYFTPGNPVIHLPKNERFCLVFYSYNNTTRPDISRVLKGTAVDNGEYGVYFPEGANLEKKIENHSNSVMWGKIADTGIITDGVKLSSVMFTHLFSQLTWTLNSNVGTITACSGYIKNTYEEGEIDLSKFPMVDIGSNGDNIWTGHGSTTFETPIEFNNLGQTAITSSKTSFCPKNGENLILKFTNISVGGRTFSGKEILTGKQLKRGVSYVATSTIKRKLTVTFKASLGGTVSPEGEQTVTKYGEKIVCNVKHTASSYSFAGWYRDNVKVETGNGVTVTGTKLEVIMGQQTEGAIYTAVFLDQHSHEWAPANLYYQDGEYIFKNVEDPQIFDKNAFFLPNREKPNDGITSKMEYDGNPLLGWTWDPCSLVKYNGGGWRLPTWKEVWYTFGHYDDTTNQAFWGQPGVFLQADFNETNTAYYAQAAVWTPNKDVCAHSGSYGAVGYKTLGVMALKDRFQDKVGFGAIIAAAYTWDVAGTPPAYTLTYRNGVNAFDGFYSGDLIQGWFDAADGYDKFDVYYEWIMKRNINAYRAMDKVAYAPQVVRCVRD